MSRCLMSNFKYLPRIATLIPIFGMSDLAYYCSENNEINENVDTKKKHTDKLSKQTKKEIKASTLTLVLTVTVVIEELSEVMEKICPSFPAPLKLGEVNVSSSHNESTFLTNNLLIALGKFGIIL
uniref:Uncharacterized protein n=2 Tax=Cacopsylla melanoneura TaxID=428564 RepID=A0A8D8SHJ7_9HEMI